MKYIIANWKAHKTADEAQQWLKKFLEKAAMDSRVKEIMQTKAKVIVCPPHPFISVVRENLPADANIFLGAQDVSAFEEGSDTGETTAKMLAGLVRFAIIGHSERRTLFHETENMIEKKVSLAKQYDIEPILCIRDEKDVIYPQATIVAYEPQESIGTGKYKPVADILDMRSRLKMADNQVFIYGGSVNEHMCKDYLVNPDIHGLLVGTASLDPEQFFQIVSQVT